MWVLMGVVLACAGGEPLPGKIVCGEGTEPYGEGCIPSSPEDSGESDDT